MGSFLMGTSVWIYIIIFVGKIIEVSLATMRMVLINRGEKTIGSIIAFFEVVLWIYIASAVIIGIRDDYLKAIVYSIAYAIGNFLGSSIENKLAIGYCTIQVITADDDSSKLLIESLRAKNLAVTVMDGEGKDGKKKVLLIHLKRTKIDKVLEFIKASNVINVITISDLKLIRGGFIRK